MRLLSTFNFAFAHLCFLSLLAAVSVTSESTSYSPPAVYATVKLRIEGDTSTIYEGFIVTKAHNVTTTLGGEHKCDGTNNAQNAAAGPTLTGALDDAAHLKDFTWDGPWYSSFEDFFVTRIANSDSTDTKFWGLLKGYNFTEVGGCQQRVKNGDDILIAYDAFNAGAFLKLSSSSYFVKKGDSAVVTVIDGTTGTPIVGATVGGQATEADGTVALTFGSRGVQNLKAEKIGTVRSNAVVIYVY